MMSIVYEHGGEARCALCKDPSLFAIQNATSRYASSIFRVPLCRPCAKEVLRLIESEPF